MSASLKKKKVSKKKKVTKKARKAADIPAKKAKTKKSTSKKVTKFPQGRHPNQVKTLKKNAFKPGQSGNPKGRKPGTVNFKTIINHILDKEFTSAKMKVLLQHKYDSRKKGETAHIERLCSENEGKINYREAIILAQVISAVRGDTTAFNALADRTEGKPKQMVATVEVSYEDFLDDLPDPDEYEDE